MKPSNTKEIAMGDAAQLLSLPQVAKFLGVCSRTISRRVAEGELAPPIKVGRSARWFQTDLNTYLQRLVQLRQVKGGRGQ